MLQKTKGICLHWIKYSESSIVATIYTEHFGRQSYMVNGVFGKKAPLKANLFQPLFILEMDVYHKPGRDLQRIKEAHIGFPYTSIPYDVFKSTQVVFIAELLFRTLREEEPNPKLFDFIVNALKMLDLQREGTANFSLYFMLKLLAFLGASPHIGEQGEAGFLDLKNGVFTPLAPAGTFFIDKFHSSILKEILSCSPMKLHLLRISNEERRVLMTKLTEYYEFHFEGSGSMKSLKVLQEIFQ